MIRTEKDKMLGRQLYDPSAPEIQADLAATHRWLARYNAALDMAPSERPKQLVERFAAVGEGAVSLLENAHDFPSDFYGLTVYGQH
jgi:maltose O-acetyltransferase